MANANLQSGAAALAASVSAGVVDAGHSAAGSGTRQTPSLLPLEHAVQTTVVGAGWGQALAAGKAGKALQPVLRKKDPQAGM